MPGRAKGTVVPFERPQRPLLIPRVSEGNPEIPPPWLDRLFETGDAGVNAEWDRLLSLVVQAWCWRDPDSIGELEECLSALRRSVDREWS